MVIHSLSYCSLKLARVQFFFKDTSEGWEYPLTADVTAVCSPGFFKHDSPAMAGKKASFMGIWLKEIGEGIKPFFF